MVRLILDVMVSKTNDLAANNWRFFPKSVIVDMIGNVGKGPADVMFYPAVPDTIFRTVILNGHGKTSASTRTKMQYLVSMIEFFMYCNSYDHSLDSIPVPPQDAFKFFSRPRPFTIHVAAGPDMPNSSLPLNLFLLVPVRAVPCPTEAMYEEACLVLACQSFNSRDA